MIPPQWRGRAMVCVPLEMVPVEAVARGYLAGSGLSDYRATGSVCGVALPEGLVDGDRLPEPIFTPATKADLGEHDENVSYDAVVATVGAPTAARLRELTLAIYERARDIAAARGIILADTKFEFGHDPVTGELVLGDEVLTPDSSRFWPADSWEPGHAQPSYDKQFVRDWLTSSRSGWDRAADEPPPTLPEDVVQPPEPATSRHMSGSPGFLLPTGWPELLNIVQDGGDSLTAERGARMTATASETPTVPSGAPLPPIFTTGRAAASTVRCAARPVRWLGRVRRSPARHSPTCRSAARPMCVPPSSARASAQRAWAARPVRERTAVRPQAARPVLARQDESWISSRPRTASRAATRSSRSRTSPTPRATTPALRARLLHAKRRTGLFPVLTSTHELHHPKGVVAIVSPWNYPLALGVGDTIPALIAGNAVVQKPDNQTALTALWALSLAREAGLPDGRVADRARPRLDDRRRR